MKTRRLCSALILPTAILVAILLNANFVWSAPGGRIVHAFTGGTDGGQPSTLLVDSAGNLYGLALGGGLYNFGAFFEFTHSAGGGWKENILYNFTGFRPSAGLVEDSAGNFYGLYANSGSNGCGAIYQISPDSQGVWNQTLIYNFVEADGCLPENLTIDATTGNLYGTTLAGGNFSAGTIFELAPVTGGGWKFSSLYSFTDKLDGSVPMGTLTLDSLGNLYGTANKGGLYQLGTVFELVQSSGIWTEKTLYSFTGGDNGESPTAGVIFDKKGNLYGTAPSGGADNVGNVFALSPTKGYWNITVIHAFTGGTDGASPAPFNLTIDTVGNLYGAAESGGYDGYGTLYKLSPASGGNWTDTVLHDFTNGIDGSFPDSGIVLDSSGDLFGSNFGGGAGGNGVVYEGILK